MFLEIALYVAESQADIITQKGPVPVIFLWRFACALMVLSRTFSSSDYGEQLFHDFPELSLTVIMDNSFYTTFQNFLLQSL